MIVTPLHAILSENQNPEFRHTNVLVFGLHFILETDDSCNSRYVTGIYGTQFIGFANQMINSNLNGGVKLNKTIFSKIE